MDYQHDPQEAQWVLQKFAAVNPDVFWMVSPDWSELKFVDEAYEELWGEPTATLAADPTSFLTQIHPEDRPSVESHMDKLSAGDPAELEFRIIPADSDGHERHVWAKGQPVYDDGEFVAIAGFVRDITAREQERLQLQETNDRLETFASFLSHDLLNQLSIAQGWLQQAQESHSSDALDTVAVALDRIEEMSEDILSLLRMDGEAITTAPVSLTAVAEACWHVNPDDDATLTTAGDLLLQADRGCLRHVLENLFDNSRTHGDGPVTVTVGALPDRDGFYVADNGPGIPPEERADVFDYEHTTAAEGTGLGLAVVARIAAAHEWEVAVTESTDGGARFEFTGVDT